MDVVDCYWNPESTSGLADLFENATVKAAALLKGQLQTNLEAIRKSMAALVEERFGVQNGWRVPVPAALVTARKALSQAKR